MIEIRHPYYLSNTDRVYRVADNGHSRILKEYKNSEGVFCVSMRFDGAPMRSFPIDEIINKLN